jgi:ferric-dicitrate binding protein FerR (iron transport regulator)
VKAYPDEAETQVAVAEGKVALRREQAAPQDTVLLQAYHLGRVTGQHLEAVRSGVDLARQMAWTRGELVFTDTPFSEVVRKLERWYNLRIDVQVTADEVDRLNATFSDESLSDVVRAVAAGLDLEYTWDGERVVFYRGDERAASST